MHIGPITLGMHYNPYGESLADNPNTNRLEMAEIDYRHDSLISLTWSIAVFSEIISKNTKYITFASLKGLHGIMTNDNQKRPLFYLYEVLQYFKDAKIFKINKINSIFGVKLLKDSEVYYLLANTSSSNEEYIKEVASYVDKKMHEVQRSVPSSMNASKIAILAAMNISDELFGARRGE